MVVNTMGIVAVDAFAATAAGVVKAAISRLKLCLPTAPGCQLSESGELGTSPFFEQLSGKQSAC
jgi:hypothetical protein